MNAFLKQAIVAITLLISASAISAMTLDSMHVEVFPNGQRAWKTQLAEAAARGNFQKVKNLVNLGANLNKPGYNEVIQGHMTALDFALVNGHTTIANYLRSEGAKTAEELGYNG